MNENITKHRHEEATTAIDREIHQDHHHTSIQPIIDREVLPEKHSHNIVGVETREHRHGDDAAVKARLEQERLQFQNTRTQGETKETHSVAPVIAGEHIHHHVHEVRSSLLSIMFGQANFQPVLQTIQPVVQKETIQPSVVHTTIPIHEIHQNEAKHHAASALPAVSMADFKKQGGSLQGREERYDGFEGEPKAVGGALGGSHHQSGTTSGPHSSNLENKLDPRVDSDRDGSRNLGAASSGQYGSGSTGTGYGSGTTGSGYGSGTTGTAGSGYGSGTTGSGYGHDTSRATDTTGKKPGLLDRLNPLKDTDGDGKKGVLE